jgi:hypothetical protein
MLDDDSQSSVSGLGDEQQQYYLNKVTIEHWARTRRQKAIRDLSFESKEHNIYDPNFSSASKE